MTIDTARLPDRLWIGGEWVEGLEHRRFLTLDPASGEPIGALAEAGAADVDRAVAAARAALREGPWPTMSGAQRGRILQRMAALLRERFDEIVTLESLDAGKPISATRRQDIPAAIDCLEYYAGWADKLAGETIPTGKPGAFTYTTLAPVGVVAAIVPWNFPLMNAVWKVAPALACGCTIVLKPAELTPLSALWLAALAAEAGLPAGVLNVIPGPGAEVGAALVAHAGVDKISFTGSPRVGREIMRAAATHISRVGLELGGKAANIVCADADLDAAVRQSVSGAFFNARQVCSAGARILVDRRIQAEFVERVAARVAALRLGDTLDPATTLGPVISEGQRQRVLGYVADGMRQGARLVTGGEKPDRPGYFISPAVFDGVDDTMVIAHEEIFGPVVSVLSFRDEAEALELANGTAYSLAGAVWSRDIDRAHRMAAGLRAGTVWINTYGHTDTRLPWGGMGGESGVGRDLGRAALANYTEQKTVWLQVAPAAA